MPTCHVPPDSQEKLQEIADSLFKARKVVVVTGAGISTNSGIPDFRSENGLYSLIQAQFDAAAQEARQRQQAIQTSLQTSLQTSQSEHEPSETTVTSEIEEEPPRKRRRLSQQGTIEVCIEAREVPQRHVYKGTRSRTNRARQAESETTTVEREGILGPEGAIVEPRNGHDLPDEDAVDGEVVIDLPTITPRKPRRSMRLAKLLTSPLSSPPPEDLIIPPPSFQSHAFDRLADLTVQPSSSPLSSPPPVLFDPFVLSSPSESHPSRRSSTSPSEVDETPPSTNPPTASQSSAPGRNTLPNMKGKDLFDSSIWADPLRTSVFYTFATTLRQKVRDIKPTSSHRFISHLRDRGKLVRCYTQNIDQIEEKVGLSTSLLDGPGARGRFSRKSTANLNQLIKMVDEASSSGTDSSQPEKPLPTTPESSQQAHPDASQESTETTVKADSDQSQSDSSKAQSKHPRRDLPRSGVECVFLHGSLEQLRCFLCGRVCSWDDADRELETLSGQQPECPHCVGAATAREERGKRALGVGKLRPDIVLYGEEHPSAHLISPIITHDLALSPDMLLILGTSLRVHGLKVMVREFAKAVHAKGGKVVFVNFTKPPESSWGDVIDYWIEWDCDAWVTDLQDKIPKLWQAPEPPKLKKKKETSGSSDDNEKERKKRPPAANPVALRDTKANGAYWTLRIVTELHRITGVKLPERRASVSGPVRREKTRKLKRPRKSAPGALNRPKANDASTPFNHLRPPPGKLPELRFFPLVESKKPTEHTEPTEPTEPAESTNLIEPSSIFHAVKSEPRIRRRKTMYGEDETKKRERLYRLPFQDEIARGQNTASTTLPLLKPATRPLSRETRYTRHGGDESSWQGSRVGSANHGSTNIATPTRHLLPLPVTPMPDQAVFSSPLEPTPIRYGLGLPQSLILPPIAGIPNATMMLMQYQQPLPPTRSLESAALSRSAFHTPERTFHSYVPQSILRSDQNMPTLPHPLVSISGNSTNAFTCPWAYQDPASQRKLERAPSVCSQQSVRHGSGLEHRRPSREEENDAAIALAALRHQPTQASPLLPKPQQEETPLSVWGNTWRQIRPVREGTTRGKS